MFYVYDNNKPAKLFPDHPAWGCNKFTLLREAIMYANAWLGEYGPLPENFSGKYDYSGYGDILEIREQ